MKIFISYLRADSTYLIGRIRDQPITAFGGKQDIVSNWLRTKSSWRFTLDWLFRESRS